MLPKDYKDTLNLPQTDFPMKANLAQREPELLQHWETIQLYKKLRAQRAGCEKFILHDGPPYANGHIHIGHAVNKTLKDIVIKAKTLEGFDAPYVPGWDCHGLPIELNVEKKFGKAGTKLSAKEFRAACRAYATEQLNIQREEFKRLGVIGDWDNPYLTMDYSFEANTVRALTQLIAKDHLQAGFKPVHWCVDCASALAEAEVEYQNKVSPAIDVKFTVINEDDFWQRLAMKPQGEGAISIPIWTTTPWTLPANEAVALNAAIQYALIQVETIQGPTRLIIAHDLLAACLKRYGIEEHQQLAHITGKQLEFLALQHPLFDKQVPVILAEHVTLDAGTGAVHTAPAHGPDDYMAAQHYKLVFQNPVSSNGCYIAQTPLLAGKHISVADPLVIEILKQKNNLLNESKLEHSYPHCWRHKTPLYFLATPQWFISMEKQGLRAHALQAIEKVQWIPSWGKARIYGMVEQRPDWCISRQRTWGVPLPLIVHKETRQLHARMLTLLETIAQRIEKSGVDTWYELPLTELIGDESSDYEKVTDVLDVWFDSGVTHFCVMQKNPALAWPADVYLEGSDQHRGWFQTSLLTAAGLYQTAPYKTVLTHGFTVDEKGRKMSKSLGNVIAPEKVINSLGADILRLWIASTDYRTEIAVSDEILKRAAEAYRRLRNTTRFLLANLHDFEPEQHLLPVDQLLSLDRWMLARTQAIQEEVRKAYANFEFHLIYHKLHNFCINDLGGFYLDIIKDRQYTMQKNSRGRRSAQTVLFHIAEAMVRWFAPILSFTAEEIWKYLPGKRHESVFLNQWHVFPTNEITETENQFWQELLTLRAEVNKKIEEQRNLGNLGSSLEAEITITTSSTQAAKLQKLGDELRFVFIVSSLNLLIDESITDFSITVNASKHTKCERCWHRRADVGTHAEHPTLCGRCVENLPEGNGERRQHA